MLNIQKIMKKIRLKISLIIPFLLLFTYSAKSQQFKSNNELGIIAGGSYYLGDLNNNHFDDASASLGLIYRKNIDRRLSYKAGLMYLNLKSDERDSEDTIALDRGLHFRSKIFELSGQIEFNFLPYQPGNPLYTWTPFVYTGLAIFNFNPQAENKNGEWVNLQELGTEGQGTTTSFNGETRDKYSLIQFSIPMGGGVKFSINQSTSVILEYGIRKTFTDYLDDVSTTYPGPNLYDMTNEAWEMSDPNGTHLKGDQRGDATKKDWYSFIGLTLSFKLDTPNDCPPY